MNLLILNLCVNIALAYILFIVGVERTENEVKIKCIYTMNSLPAINLNDYIE